jgi:hypothetical protein
MNMTILHTLRLVCGQNPSAPQYFCHSTGEYMPVAVAANPLLTAAPTAGTGTGTGAGAGAGDASAGTTGGADGGVAGAMGDLHHKSGRFGQAAGEVIGGHGGEGSSSPVPINLPLGWSGNNGDLSVASNALVSMTKEERVRLGCSLDALEDKIVHTEPLMVLYTKLLYNLESSFLRYDPHSEFKRMGIPNSMWRISYANVHYELCDSYPSVLAFPKAVDDDTLANAANFRSKQRLPTLCWRSTYTNATICRSSQPMIGLGNSRNLSDELLLKEMYRASNNNAALQASHSGDATAAFSRQSSHSQDQSIFSSGVQMSDKSDKSLEAATNALHSGSNAPVSTRRFVIADARPLLNARANQAAGKGVESDKNYENCNVVFLDIANIHAMRKSMELMVEANAADDANWLRNAETAGWIGHIRKVLLGATKIVHLLAYENLSVLVHCSDGWDRTSQLTSLSMLMMDGFYRTLKGFIVLVEKEWLSFGHKFGDRLGWSGHGLKSEECSPIFAQFLDCVHQFIVQVPNAFEFNEELLLFIMSNLTSGWYGNFLFNTEYELKFHVGHKSLLSIWTPILGNKERYVNPNYAAADSPVVPVVSKSKLVIWSGWFLAWQDKLWSSSWIETAQLDRKYEAAGAIDKKEVVVCFKCMQPFTLFRRKHHCRVCWQIFCYACCHTFRIVPAISSRYPSRCCAECSLLLEMDFFEDTENAAAVMASDTATNASESVSVARNQGNSIDTSTRSIFRLTNLM